MNPITREVEFEIGESKLTVRKLSVRQIAAIISDDRKRQKQAIYESLVMAGHDKADIAATLADFDGRPFGDAELLRIANSTDGQVRIVETALRTDERTKADADAILDSLSPGVMLPLACELAGLVLRATPQASEGDGSDPTKASQQT